MRIHYIYIIYIIIYREEHIRCGGSYTVTSTETATNAYIVYIVNVYSKSKTDRANKGRWEWWRRGFMRSMPAGRCDAGWYIGSG